MSDALKRRAAAAVVFVATFAVFAPLVGAGFLNYDDDTQLVRNANWRGFTPANVRWMVTDMRGIWSPLGWMSHAVDWHLWGLRPAGHHLTNVLLHALNALLLFMVILRLVPGAPVGAAVAALAWSLHPLRVEPVAWVTERWDLLACAFYLLTVLAHLRLAAEEDGARRRRWYALSIAAAVLCVLSKAWGMTIPVVLLALDAWPLRRLSRAAWREKIPFVAISAATAAIAVAAQKSAGALVGLGSHGVAERAAQAAYGLCFYVAKTAAPVGLSPMYPLRVDVGRDAALYAGCALAVVAVTAALVACRRRAPAALAAWACFVVLVSPVLGVAQSGPAAVADRYTYLAALPLSALAAAGLARAGARAAWGAAIVPAALGALAVPYQRVWMDSVSLWNRVVERAPDDYFARFNRGHARFTAGDLDGARADYAECDRLNPGYVAAARRRAEQLATAATARQDRGEWAAARKGLEEAVRLDPFLVAAWNNLGLARRAEGDGGGAVEAFGVAVRLDPSFAWAWANRALVRLDRGDVRGAVADFEKALEVAPAGWPPREAVERDAAELKRRLAP